MKMWQWYSGKVEETAVPFLHRRAHHKIWEIRPLRYVQYVLDGIGIIRKIRNCKRNYQASNQRNKNYSHQPQFILPFHRGVGNA